MSENTKNEDHKPSFWEILATPVTAFFAGGSLPVLDNLIHVLYNRNRISIDPESSDLFPFLVLYFFFVMAVFVIGIHNILSPPKQKSLIPFGYFPANREGWKFYFEIWKRMLFWFIGAALVGLLIGDPS